MATAESFLHGGLPVHAIHDLPNYFSDYHSHSNNDHHNKNSVAWRWVVYFPRQWALDGLLNKVTAPAFHLLLVQHNHNHNENNKDSWHLAMVLDQIDGQCLFGLDCNNRLGNNENNNNHHQHSEIEKAGLCSLILSSLAVLPAGERDRVTSITVTALLEGTVHETIYLFETSRWSKLQEVLSQQQQHKNETIVFEKLYMESSNAFSALVKRGFEWAKQQNNNTNTNDEEESNETKRDRYRSSFHDCSFPPMSTSVAKKLFRLFSDNVNSENFQLFSESLLVEEKTAQKLVSPKKEETPTDDSKIAQLKAEGALALETWKKSRGECFACTIHDNNNNANIPTYKHWLFRQMPFVHVEEKEKISFENREVGARCPCPPAVELHAFRDPGDLAFLNNENVLHNPSLRDFCLEDYLRKEEGELFFQLRPVEGVAFENIERFLNSRTAVPRADKNSESCCGLSVPILYRRLPSATSIKANPLAKAHVAVQYVSLEQDSNENENNTEDERILVDAFINDLQWFVTHQVTSLQQYSNTINNNNEQKVWGQYGSPGYTLRLPDKNNNEDGYCMTAPTEVDTKQCPPCGYCGRRLVLKKLFRCSACRRSYYCCKEHQRLDWGNGHKERCAGYKLETNFLEKKVQPFLEKDKNNHQKRDKAWSVAASLLAYIDHTISNDNHNAVWTLHAVFIESSSLFEKETTKHMLEQLQVLWTESDTYQHITDYLGNNNNKNNNSIRVLLCCEDFVEEHNNVYSINNNSNNKVLLLPPSGVLGDTWHTEGNTNHNNNDPTFLVRFTATKYHHLPLEPYSNNPNTNKNTSENNKTTIPPPDALLLFGPPSGDGISFFCAALQEVLNPFTLNYGFHLPIRVMDSQFSGSWTTMSVVDRRLSDNNNNEKWNAWVQSRRNKSKEGDGLLFDIMFNKNFYAVEEESEEPLPLLYGNGFYFDITAE